MRQSCLELHIVMMYGILLGSLLICCTRKEYISKPVVQPFLKVGFRNSSKQPKVPADFDSDSSEEFHKRPTPGYGSNESSDEDAAGSPKSNVDMMNEELKLVLESFRRQRPHLDIQKTPDVYIYQTSTPQEVQKWLEMKGFSKRIRKQFEGVDGEKLFALDRDQLIIHCGKAEGIRLDSQITIQRNITGYKTARSSELRQILAQRRNKVEADKTDAKESITEDFSFLRDYDKSGYQTDSESDDEDMEVPGASGGLAGTLKEQIKKQRKKIQNQALDDKASR